MRFMQGVFLLSLGLLIAFGACRRNQPVLVDKNESPDTELWYAPPDSTDYEYKVHLYWRGVDNDGTATSFIWTIRDSIVEEDESDLRWDPANKLRDFREGRITTRTDSVFSFTAFREIEGLGVNTKRQAFLIAAIDDNGVIDPSPAWTEFIAKIDKFPEIAFWTHIDGEKREYIPQEIPSDTVGVMHPFGISFSGSTTNGKVNAYKFFPLAEVFVEGQDIWNEDLTDTMVTLPNTGDDLIPSGVFKLAVKCRDDASAESPVDVAPPNERGVCQVVVNFDPETQFLEVLNTYHTSSGMVEEDVVFNDGIPDTVPYRSYVRIRYWGQDDDRDEKIACNEDLAPDSCIGFQVAYRYFSPYSGAANEFSQWQPRGDVHDTDPLSSTDSNTFFIGSLNYELMARAVDEHGRPDGTPPSIDIVGNFVPTLDSVAVEDHLGNRLDLSVVDTLTFNFWKGVGWPYQCGCDTVDYDDANFGCVVPFIGTDPLECRNKEFPLNAGSGDFVKHFYWKIKAWGHDNPKDPPPGAFDKLGSGIKSWNYLILNRRNNQVVNLAKSNIGWFEQRGSSGGIVVNALDDEYRFSFYYPGPDSPNPDTLGVTVFENLPAWLGQSYTVILKGRDTPPRSSNFGQWILINGNERLFNSFSDASLGRQTQERMFAFHVELVR